MRLLCNYRMCLWDTEIVREIVLKHAVNQAAMLLLPASQCNVAMLYTGKGEDTGGLY